MSAAGVCAWCGEPAYREYRSEVFERRDLACRSCSRWLEWDRRLAQLVNSVPPWVGRTAAMLTLSGAIGVTLAYTLHWLGRL